MGMGILQPRSPPSCPADPQVTGQGAAHPILLHPACHPHPPLRAVPGEVRSPKRGSFIFFFLHVVQEKAFLHLSLAPEGTERRDFPCLVCLELHTVQFRWADLHGVSVCLCVRMFVCVCARMHWLCIFFRYVKMQV